MLKGKVEGYLKDESAEYLARLARPSATQQDRIEFKDINIRANKNFLSAVQQMGYAYDTPTPIPEPKSEPKSEPKPELGFEKPCNDLICFHTKCEEMKKVQSEKDKAQLTRYEFFQKLLTKCPNCSKNPKVIIDIYCSPQNTKISCTCSEEKTRCLYLGLNEDEVHYIKNTIIPLNPESKFVDKAEHESRVSERNKARNYVKNAAMLYGTDELINRDGTAKPIHKNKCLEYITKVAKPITKVAKPKPETTKQLRRSSRLLEKYLTSLVPDNLREPTQETLDHCINLRVCPKCPSSTSGRNYPLFISPSGSYLRCNQCGFYVEKANDGKWKSRR